MRTLLYVPIIHMAADLGTLAPAVGERGIMVIGEEVWKKHMQVVENFWDSLASYFNVLEARGFKLYQDGLPANGDVGQKIVEEGVKNGSKNYEIISMLIRKGAILVKTEDPALLKMERDSLVKLIEAETGIGKAAAYLKYKLSKNHLLKKRDRFIADRINETLKQGETGIIFIGAYHNIIPVLDEDIRIKEVKKTDKVKTYQRLLPFHKKYKEQFEELSRYMGSPVIET
ncbi:MAG: hypothetical protein HY754_10165 [Nitrospirae bacterium]|nr:hypothetical protein [Nitrospirota bacterium]